MASNKKVITLGLDYSQLDAGTAEINRKMGLLEAQFKLTKEQIKAYGDESDTLTLQNDKLTQQIILQTKKVELAKEAYDKALASGTATDKSLDNLQKSYIANQTQLQKLNNELDDNKQKLDKVNESSKSFGDSIRGVASSLGLNVSPALETVASKFDGVNKSIGNAVLGIGAIITGFISCSISTAHMADELLTLSSVTGIATDQLQKMQYASNFLDVDVDTMTSTMTKLERSMDSARDGSKDLQETFKKLHVTVADGNGQLKNAEDVFYDTIDALGRVKNETERDTLAMQLFGKSAKELNPLIEAGSTRLKELGNEAEKLGHVMSEKELEKAAKFQDALDGLGETSKSLKNNLGLALIPMLTVLFSTIAKIPEPVLQTIVVLASVVATIVLVVKAIDSMTGTAKAVSGFFKGMKAETWETVGIILAVVAALIALVAIIAVLAGKGQELNSSMNSIGNSVSQVTNTVNSVPQNTARSVGYANGTKNAQGGMAWVGESGPELMRIPTGSQVYSNSDSKEMSTGDTIYNYFSINARDIKEVENLIDIMNSYKQTVRQGRLKNA